MNVLVGTLGETTTDRGDTVMSTSLPDFAEAGDPGRWTFTDRYGSETEIEGDFLGMGSSHRPSHQHRFPPYAEPGKPCSACRWTEVRIFQESGAPRRYLVVRTGHSTVPEEETRTSFGYLGTASEVVRSLISWSDEGAASLAYGPRQALVQASAYDDGLSEAYEAALAGVLS